jgi:hypothetical protein
LNIERPANEDTLNFNDQAHWEAEIKIGEANERQKKPARNNQLRAGFEILIVRSVSYSVGILK